MKHVDMVCAHLPGTVAFFQRHLQSKALRLTKLNFCASPSILHWRCTSPWRLESAKEWKIVAAAVKAAKSVFSSIVQM